MDDPIFAEGGGVRTVPFSKGGQPSSTPAGANGMGVNTPGAQQSGAIDPNDLTPEEVDHIKAAAEAGDPEAQALGQQLNLWPLAAGAGAAAAGYGLYRALRGRGGKPNGGQPPGPTNAKMSNPRPAPSGGLPSKDPNVHYLNWEDIPPGPGQVSGPGGKQLGTMQAPLSRDGTNSSIGYMQGNPNNLPATRQGSTDAAYSQKAMQDAAAAKAVEGANPGRAAARTRLYEAAHALRRVVR